MPITKNGNIYDSFAPTSFSNSAKRLSLKDTGLTI